MAFIAKLTKLVRDQKDETAIRDPYIKFFLTHPDLDMVSKSAYQDSDFFIASFLTLFLYGIRGYKDICYIKEVLLKA